MVISFSAEAIGKAEEDFLLLDISPEIQKALGGVVNIIAKYVPIKVLALRTFVIESILETQKKTGLFVKDIATMPMRNRNKFIFTVFAIVQSKLESILLKTSSASLTALETAMGEALKFRLSLTI